MIYKPFYSYMGRGECVEKFKRIKTEKVYEAHVFDVYNDYLELPDGRNVVYDLIRHNSGSCILPVMGDGTIVLVKQYRNSIDDITYEVPAGFIDVNETPQEAALRELREETGYVAEKTVFVSKTVLAIGTSDEQTYVYIGMDLSEGVKNPDEDEFVENARLSMDDALDMIRNGKIVDSKTIIAIYAYNCMRLGTKI